MRPRRKPQPSSPALEAKPPAPVSPSRPPAAPVDTFEEEEPPRRSLGDWIHREMLWFDAFLRRWLLRFMVIGTHTIVALGACYFIVWSVARGMIYDNVEKVPPRACALVLGTIPQVDGRENIFFKTRIKAAAELFQAGKVQFLIVSGDNSNRGYDEPTEMKAALIQRGVPANRIYCDYAGFRTLDSIVRAHSIFGQTRFTIVSQPFHNERALYIARRKGLVDCVAFNAANANTESTVKMYLREVAARLWAILDVEFLKTAPKYLGEKIEIGEKHPPVDANPLPRR